MATNEPVEESSQEAGDGNLLHEPVKEHNKMFNNKKEHLDNDGDNVNDGITENHSSLDNTTNNNDIIERNLANVDTDYLSDNKDRPSKVEDGPNTPLSDNQDDSGELDSNDQQQAQSSTIEEQNDPEDDEELEEGELKDDDDDDDDDDADDDDKDAKTNDSKRLADENDDLNNDFSKYKRHATSNRKRKLTNHSDPSVNQYYHDSASNSGPSHPYQQHHHQGHNPHNLHQNRRHLSPNQQQQVADMHSPYPPNHQFANNSNSNQFRYQPNHDGVMMGPMLSMPPHMTPIPMVPGPPMQPMYPRGGPGNVAPIPKLNVRCRFYSKTSNKCTWGDQCRFEHRDDSPGPGEMFDHRAQPGPHPVMQMRNQPGPPLAPMGPADRPYPPYAARNQPYPMPPHGYVPYDPYGPQPTHHHQSPPLPPHSMQPHHWRQQHSPVYQQSPSGSAHPPTESLSPPRAAGPVGGGSSGRGESNPAAGPVGPVSEAVGADANAPASSSSAASTAAYERRHRLAHELAPWNDRGGYPPNKYERGEPIASSGYPSVPPSSRGSYRSQYSRDPYARDYPAQQPYYMGGGGPPHSSYPPAYPPNYPSAYNNRGGPLGPHASHYRYMSSSHRNVPPESRHPRSSKRGHDEDESSWSDSGSEDSILGQTSYSNKTKSKKLYRQHIQAQHQSSHLGQRHQETTGTHTTPLPDETNSNDNPLDHGSGTPPLPEGDDRQEMLLNKLKEIEDMMERKRREQEQKDPCDD